MEMRQVCCAAEPKGKEGRSGERKHVMYVAAFQAFQCFYKIWDYMKLWLFANCYTDTYEKNRGRKIRKRIAALSGLP